MSFFGAEIEKFFIRFLVQVKIAKSPFEINWPLDSTEQAGLFCKMQDHQMSFKFWIVYSFSSRPRKKWVYNVSNLKKKSEFVEPLVCDPQNHF